MAGPVETQLADQPVGNSGGDLLQLLYRIDDGETASTVFVGDVGDVSTVGADVERLDVPRHVLGQLADFLRDRIEARNCANSPS